MFDKPKGKEVVCHASAWDVNINNDLRIKMCINKNQEDLVTIHHELGHNYYYNNYYTAARPVSERRERRLPRGDRRHGRAVDDARVHEGEGPARRRSRRTTRRRSTSRWTSRSRRSRSCRSACSSTSGAGTCSRARCKPGRVQQALVGPEAEVPGRRAAGRAHRGRRSIPGAKYHIPANTPYMRYFLARGAPVPVPSLRCARRPATPVRCTSARSTATRKRARRSRRCSQMGASKPWQDALFELTGQREMDATRDPRVLRAAAEVARGAEQGPAVRLVSL